MGYKTTGIGLWESQIGSSNPVPYVLMLQNSTLSFFGYDNL